jgi:hypothetical protein
MKPINLLFSCSRFFATERYPGRRFLVDGDEPAQTQPNEETKAKNRHRFFDNFNRRKGFAKCHEVMAMLRHYRRGGHPRPLQLDRIQERLADLSIHLPPEQVNELQQELLQLQQENNEMLPPVAPNVEPGVGVPNPNQGPVPQQLVVPLDGDGDSDSDGEDLGLLADLERDRMNIDMAMLLEDNDYFDSD